MRNRQRKHLQQQLLKSVKYDSSLRYSGDVGIALLLLKINQGYLYTPLILLFWERRPQAVLPVFRGYEFELSFMFRRERHIMPIGVRKFRFRLVLVSALPIHGQSGSTSMTKSRRSGLDPC